MDVIVVTTIKNVTDAYFDEDELRQEVQDSVYIVFGRPKPKVKITVERKYD